MKKCPDCKDEVDGLVEAMEKVLGKMVLERTEEFELMRECKSALERVKNEHI